MTSSPAHTTTPPPPAMVRPPILPPSKTVAFPRVSLLHPGYGTDNILFSLFAVDGTRAEPGLHHRTILTAGAIIANNAFDHVYLTYDQAGRDRVETPLDSTLAPGSYWLQLRGHELPSRPQPTSLTSMPPPSWPASAAGGGEGGSSATQPWIPGGQTQQPSSTSPSPTLRDPYPIVASFGDWQFPHHNLPSEWKQRHHAPSLSSSSAASPPSAARRCCITGCQMGLHECHLVPKTQFAWWATNNMRNYIRGNASLLQNEANLALLRADVHALFDRHQIGIVPKPSSTSPPPPGQHSHASVFAFAAHVLEDDAESCEFYDLQYHNVAISQAAVDRLSPEHLFARFAWAIFSKLQIFLSSPTRRHLAVTLRDETGPGSCDTEYRWMNGEELTKFLDIRGVTRSGSRSRKRSSSALTQDEQDSDISDAYQERWDRRSRSFDQADSSLRTAYLEHDARQADKTRWYEEVGQFSRARDARQEQIDEKTRWYEEVGQFSRLSEVQEQHEAHNSDNNYGVECGRPRGKPAPGLSPPGSEGMPVLSGSFTSSSNRSTSACLAKEDKVPNAIPEDKSFSKSKGDPHLHLHLEAGM